MKKNINQIILTFAVAIIFTATQANAAVVLIDDFAAGVPLSTFGTSSATNDGSHTGVLGGFRDTLIHASSGGLNIFYSPVIGNTIAFDGLAGSSGFYAAIYDGPGLDGSLGLDLLGVVANGSFSLTVIDANGTGKAHVNVLDNNGVTHSSINNITNGFAGVLNFNYADYLGAGVDLTDIKAITLAIHSSGTADDFTIGIFTATNVVPEPASLSLLGLGTLAMMRRRKRQRAA